MFNKIIPLALFVLTAAAAGAQPVTPPKPPVPPVPPAPRVFEQALELDLAQLEKLDALRGTLDLGIGPALDAARLAASVEGALAGSASLAALGAYGEALQEPMIAGRDMPNREGMEYDRATRALDRAQYEQAAAGFAKVAAIGGRKAEGAMYWEAYALSRLGKRAEAMARLDELLKKYRVAGGPTTPRPCSSTSGRPRGRPYRPTRPRTRN